MAEICLILLMLGSLPGNCTDKCDFWPLFLSLGSEKLKFQIWLNSDELWLKLCLIKMMPGSLPGNCMDKCNFLALVLILGLRGA